MRSLALLKIGCETNVSSSRFERRITSERCYKVERNLFYKELSKVKRYLKDFKLDIPFIEDAIYECLNSRGNSKKRWKRLDVAYFLSDYLISFGRNRGLNRQDLAHYIHDYIITHDDFKKAFTVLIHDIAVSIFNEVDTQSITLEPIKYIDKVDASSGKIRKIGLATIKQQVYDYIVVKACNQMFLNKIGTYQCASIKGRGQIYGKKAIEKWIRKNPKSCKWVWKGDVKKFYPSVPHDKLKELLRRDIKNDTVIYILFTLINTYDIGLCIGSYLSKSLANYYLSYAYHYLSEQCFKIRHKRDSTIKRVRLISHLLFYMDDVVIFGSSKKDRKLCIKALNKYLCTQLGLKIKNNEQLFKLDTRPIDMMGYRIYTDKTTIRKRIFKRANKMICKYRNPETIMSAKDAKSIMAYKGYFDNSDSIKYKKKHKCERIFDCARKVIKNESKGFVHGKTATISLF